MTQTLAAEALAAPFAPLASDRVIHADHVTQSNLLALARGDAIAVVVPDYFSAELGRSVVRRLLSESRYGEYENVPGVHKWGLNTYEGLSSPEREKRYFADAVPAIQSLRDTWYPHLSPIDRLRLELQEGWPAGANMEYLDGRAMFVGQARIFHAGNGAIPHQDFLSWELSHLRGVERSDGAAELVGQLTANLYLQVPDSGGQLELWTRGYDHAEYDGLRAESTSYGLDRDRIPPPSAVIEPAEGMLVLFHASRLHAVQPARGRDRVAVSCFIGVRGTDKPLTYWS